MIGKTVMSARASRCLVHLYEQIINSKDLVNGVLSSSDQ